MNENNENIKVKSNNSVLKIVILFVIALIVAGLVYLIINKDSIFKKHEFEIAGSEKMFSVGKLEEIRDDDDYVYKVELTVDNNTNYDIEMNHYLFEIVNDSEMKIGTCFGQSLAEIKKDDMFPEVAPANQVTNGYLYCLSSTTGDKQLKVTYMTNPRTDDNGKFTADKNEYYFDFK